jgi:hypothetical protein
VIRAREFPRREVVSIERIGGSSRQRRPARGLCGHIAVVGKLIVLCGGYFFAVFGIAFGGGIAFSDTAPNLAWLFGIGGIVCAVGCLVETGKVARAATWLPFEAPVLGLVLAWFFCISGGVCAVGFGVVAMMLIRAAP